MEQNKIYLFEECPVPKAVAVLAIPTILSSLVTVLYNLADTFFVGMINDPIQNSAVALAAPVLLAFTAVNNLFGIGTSSMMSRALGKKDYDTVRRSSVFGFYCAVFCSLMYSVLCLVFMDPLLKLLGTDASTYYATYQYLKWAVVCGAPFSILNVVLAFMVRSEGSALHASIGTMSGCVMNIILDPLFILPQFLNMKAEGAALATFISNVFACGYFCVFLYIKRKETYVCVDPGKFSFDPQIMRGIFNVGIPAAIQNLLNVTGMTIFNNFTSGYGPHAVAAMGIVQKVNNVPWTVCCGLSQGIMPLVSYSYTNHDRKRMKKTVLFALTINVSMILVVSSCYFLFSPQVISFFMTDPQIVHHGSLLLRGFCLGLPFLAVDFMAVGVFQAIGLGRNSLFLAIARKIILEIPAMVLLNHLFPLYGLGYSQLCAELVLAVLGAVMLKKILTEQ